MLDPRSSRILDVPGRYFTVFVFVLGECFLLHGFWTLEETRLLIAESIGFLFGEVFEQTSLKIIRAPNVQRPLAAETRQLVESTGRRNVSFDVVSIHPAPFLGDWHGRNDG